MTQKSFDFSQSTVEAKNVVHEKGLKTFVLVNLENTENIFMKTILIRKSENLTLVNNCSLRPLYMQRNITNN